MAHMDIKYIAIPLTAIIEERYMNTQNTDTTITGEDTL